MEGDVRDLADHARAGHPVEAGVLRHAFHALGRAVAPWVAAFRPDVLVVGGGMSAAWDLIEAPLSEGLGGGRPARPRTGEIRERRSPAGRGLARQPGQP